MTNTNKTAVIKVGGDVLLDQLEREGLAQNIKSLRDSGWQVVLLHGGGPQVNALQEKHGLTPNKVAGRRITSADDLLVVKQAIAGEVNVNLTSELIKAGLPAFGCHGASGNLIRATKRPPVVVTGAGPDPIDFGEVGDVSGINGQLLTGLLGLGVIPVIATLGVSDTGTIFNINADTTVVQIARELKADLLLLTTGVGAVFKDLNQPDSRIKEVNREQAKNLINEGIIQGGMIPKVEEAMTLLSEGVGSIAIVSGRHPGAFLAAAEGTGEFGTRIIA
ncbi:acetylglutamate kinase [Aliikangiella coralliicola]|uniref:Acetylglutamate kinase n=1 Tax=Aliikangiella coralliicola TaxID=2592383 RepID=A0A545UFE6_9GAMM|nr:acetylglutamate kinase [Aliikangiella coralliicola]TQV88192.1 acetylglutamate kinase [Aliikangiella coralliicola]